MKKPSRSLQIILSLLLAGIAVGYLIGKMLGPSLESQPSQPLWVKVAVLLLVPIILLLVVFWHEMGHVTAGLQAHFRFRFLTVGPFMWENEGGKLRFHWNKDINTAGGLALLLPDNDKRLPQRFARLAAGGPLASLLLTLLCVLLLLLLPSPESPDPGLFLLRTALWLSAIVSGFITLVTAIPFQTGGFYSDGARVLRLMRGGPSARLESLILTLVAKTTGGTRPRDLDPAILEEGILLAQAEKATFEPYFHQYKYYQKLDQRQFEEAKAALEMYIDTSDRMPGFMQQSVRLEKAFFAAFIQKDHDAAVDARGDFTPARIFPRAQLALIEAGIARLEGDSIRVHQLCQEVLDESSKAMDSGIVQLYIDWAEALKREMGEQHDEQPA